MTLSLSDSIKNEIRSIENQKSNAYYEWKEKDAAFTGRIHGLQRAIDLIEKDDKAAYSGRPGEGK